MVDNKVKVSMKNVYGRDLFYPENDTAKLIAELCGSKTFTKEQLQILKKLGYEIGLSTLDLEVETA